MKKLFLILTTICFFHNTSNADNVINITSGSIDPTPVAINNFAAIEQENAKLASNIVSVITNDLKNCGVFRPISTAAFIETITGVNHTPLFAAWQQINATLLVNGEVTKTSTGKFRVRFILWDSILEKKIAHESFELPENLWRKVSHKISDIIYSKITGSSGYFNTRIVYVSETGSYLKRIKRLAIMDQDGANHQYLTDGSDLVLTPRFSPDRKKIIYLSYKDRKPKVFTLDLRTGKSQLLGHFPGMSFAPRFSPDGQYAIMSIAKNGSTNIYEMNLRNKRIQQLTDGSSINTSPSYSPDGKKIVFQSDRTGSRQIFVMDRTGGNIKKISTIAGAYAEPNWSINNFIAFTKVSRTAGFTIGIMPSDLVDGQNYERLITNGYLVEAPSWAPNGRAIIFTKGYPPRGKNTKGLNRLHMIDFVGYNEHIVPTPNDASDPDWSHLLD